MKLETKSGSSAGKEFTCSAGDPGSIPGSGKFRGEGIDYLLVFLGFPGVSDSKESACNVEDLGLNPGLERSLEESMQPTPVFLPGESPWTE